jgi:golgi phosphoprotein 3
MLSIFEELFLLALDEERGNVLPFAKKNLAHGLAGGILAELALIDRLHSNEKRRLEVVDDAPTGDSMLDEILKEIQSSEKLRKPAFWVSQLSARPKNLRERIGERLIEKKMLYQEEKRFFWQAPSDEQNTVVGSNKFNMKYPLRSSIFSTEESNLHNLALLNVASASGLFNLIFTQDELEIARKHLHEKVVRIALDNPAMQTIEEIEQAILTSLEDDMD